MSDEKASDQAKLKRLAKALSTFVGIPLYEAFDQASRLGGFRDYAEARRAMAIGSPVHAVRVERSLLTSDTTCSTRSPHPPIRCEFRPSQSMCQIHDHGSPQERASRQDQAASTEGSSPTAD